MNTQKSIYNKLFKEEVTELSSHSVELFKVEDTLKLLDKGIAMLKDADAAKAKLAKNKNIKKKPKILLLKLLFFWKNKIGVKEIKQAKKLMPYMPKMLEA
jgi:hypothetical protein